MNPRIRRLLASVSFAGLTEGGAAVVVVPPELVEARAAFAASNDGLAGARSSLALQEAQEALDLATRELDTHGDTLAMRGFTSIAKQRIALAHAMSTTDFRFI